MLQEFYLVCMLSHSCIMTRQDCRTANGHFWAHKGLVLYHFALMPFTNWHH